MSSKKLVNSPGSLAIQPKLCGVLAGGWGVGWRRSSAGRGAEPAESVLGPGCQARGPPQPRPPRPCGPGRAPSPYLSVRSLLAQQRQRDPQQAQRQQPPHGSGAALPCSAGPGSAVGGAFAVPPGHAGCAPPRAALLARRAGAPLLDPALGFRQTPSLGTGPAPG